MNLTPYHSTMADSTRAVTTRPFAAEELSNKDNHRFLKVMPMTTDAALSAIATGSVVVGQRKRSTQVFGIGPAGGKFM